MDVSKIYEEFEFLKSFPFFDQYQLILVKSIKGTDNGPYLSDVKYSADEEDTIAFAYQEGDHEVHVFFLKEDIYFFSIKANSIDTLDSVNTMLNLGLKEDDLVKKAWSVTESLDFLEKVDKGYGDFDNFDSVLNDFIGLNDAVITTAIVSKLQALMSGKKPRMNKIEKSSIRSYLDFQLHHAKIILGMIISVKIH
jgi:hypothetical protein